MAELAKNLMSQNIWFQAAQYRAAEVKLLQHQMGIASGDSAANTPAPARKAEAKPEASKASSMMKDLQNELASASSGAVSDIGALLERVCKLEEENNSVKKTLEQALAKLDLLESKFSDQSAPKAEAKEEPKSEAKPEAEEEDDDDDFSLFGSDSEDDEEAERVKAERIKAYEERKAKKADAGKVVIAKSSITLEVKPWDDETDLKEVERMVRAIEMDGLLWGTAKLKPIGYGIMKLSITCVVEDAKVGSDDLIETIEGFEDHVQSVDVSAFQKI